MRLEGKKVYLRQPKLEEMAFVQKLWADELTMAPVGGPIKLYDERVPRWYEYQITEGGQDRLYFLIFNMADQPVGEISFHNFDTETREANFNVKVLHSMRGQGYGREAMLLMLRHYFTEFGGQQMNDDVALENKVGQETLLSFGFTHDSNVPDACMLRLTKERFEELHGLD